MNGSAHGVGAAKAQTVLRLPVWSWIGGLAGILLALAASGSLSFSHLTGKVLPGCGAGSVKGAESGMLLRVEKVQSACASLEAHPMGSLGGMWVGIKGLAAGRVVEKINPVDAAWPVSLLGATYFSAALAAWLVIGMRGRTMPRLAVWLVRLGALGSLVYVGVIIDGMVRGSKDPCLYCVASHIGNFTLWFCMEIGMLKARSLALGGSGGWKMDRSLASVVAGAVVFVLTAGVLAVPEARHLQRLVDDDKAEADRVAKALGEKFAADAKNAAAQAASSGEKPPWGAAGFRGRWLLGPKESSVRVVLLTDYQCPDCRIFEAHAMAAYDANPGVMSLSLVHFPMCLQCNPHVSKTMHANACRAARAAEAAAIIARNKASMEGGDEQAAANDMFWKVTNWLFQPDVKGDFDDAILKAKMAEFGIADFESFLKVLNGPKTLQLVQDDAQWGDALGLYYTPMMFVNGIEVRGWLTNPQALTQAINAAVAAKGPAMDARNDNPPLIGRKFREDWEKSPRVTIPPLPDKYVQGDLKAKVRVEIWGDLTEPNCKRVHDLVQTWIGKKAFNYSFRHYPVAKECNPNVGDIFPNGCLAARSVEAAGILGGSEAYFKMRTFVMEKAQQLTPTLVGLGAGMSGLDMAKFNAEVVGPGANQAVAQEVAIGRQFVARAIPAVYVDGKFVERWERKGDNVLEWIIDEAIKNPGK